VDGNHLLRRRQHGVTLIELMVAIVASGIVLFALGNIVVVNQRAMVRSRDRAAMQQHASVVMTRMARAIRGANRIEVTGAGAFQLRDLDGALASTFQLVSAADGPRLQMDGTDMADMDCTRFAVATNADTTSLTLDLEFTSQDGLAMSELNTVSIRNRTLEY